MSDTVIQLFGGDPRCEALEAAVLEVIYERASGLPVPLVLGVLKLIEHRLISDVDAP